jgi:mono/diheme cytochrome c family protein
MRWLGFAAGFALAGVTAGAVGLAVVEFGLFDTSASTPHSPIIAWATHTTMIHATQNRARDVAVPARFTPQQVLAGFRLYDADCVSCHGGPGIDRRPFASGMTPSPPYLLDAPRHWSKAELYVVVGGGVKMTGMPAWSVTMPKDAVWDVVAFLEVLPYLSATDYARLRAQTPPPPKQG